MSENSKEIDGGINAKISIVIPVYNVENYLEQCLDSVLAQTFQDFELILIDDGSPDKSGVICEQYAEKDARIRVFHQSNQGQAAARNKGVQAANTEWILFIDSDDVVHPQIAEYLYKAVVETRANASTCVRVQGETIPEKFLLPCSFECDVKTINEDVLIELYEQKSNIYWALFPSLIKKEILEKRKFTPGKIYEDNAITCQWLYEAGSIAVISATMYFYRGNPGGTMQRAFSPQKLDYLWALRTQIEFYESVQYNKLIDIICREYIQTTLWMCKCIDEELKDKKLTVEVLRKTEKVYKKYRKYITQYHRQVLSIEKVIHPYRYRIKKKLGLYKEH